jgi:hypothetical protein
MPAVGTLPGAWATGHLPAAAEVEAPAAPAAAPARAPAPASQVARAAAIAAAVPARACDQGLTLVYISLQRYTPFVGYARWRQYVSDKCSSG